MRAQEMVQGTLKPDGTLELDQKPNLSPGRVRVTVEPVTEPTRPDRFWAMLEQIWADLKARGHVPRSVEQIEAERQPSGMSGPNARKRWNKFTWNANDCGNKPANPRNKRSDGLPERELRDLLRL